MGGDDQPREVVGVRRTTPLGLAAALFLVAGSAAADEPPPEVAAALTASSVRIQVTALDGDTVASGVVVDSSGLVATSAHALGCVSRVQVELPGGQQLKADVVALDDDHDVALLRVKAKRGLELTAVQLGPAPGEGVDVHAWGRQTELRSGPVRLSRSTDLHVAMPSVQGDSGGPVLTADGRLAGIVQGYLIGRSAYGQVTVVVPSEPIAALIADVPSRGRLSRQELCASERRLWTDLNDAVARFERGELENASALYGVALGRVEKRGHMAAEIYATRGRILLELDRPDQALGDLGTALDIEEDHLYARVARAEAWARKGNDRQALVDVDRAVASHPGQYWLQGVRASLLFELGDKEEALVASHAWVSRGDADGGDLHLRCRLRLELGQPDGAADDCANSIAAGYQEPWVYLDLATSLALTGDVEGAVRALDLSIEVGTDDPAAWYNRGLSFLALERVEAALADLDRVLEQQPDNRDAHYLRSLALAKLGRRDEAVAEARRAADAGAEGAAELVEFLAAGGRVGPVSIQ